MRPSKSPIVPARATPLPELDPIQTISGRRAVVERLTKRTFQWLRKHARKYPETSTVTTFPEATVQKALKELFGLLDCNWDPEAVLTDVAYASLIVSLEPSLYSRKADRLVRSLING